MRAADVLIQEIVASSQIPSTRRRREVARELRSHIDDFVGAARDAGHTDDEIERMVRSNFGDPRQMGHNFAWVYRRERAMLRFAVYGLSTLLAALLSAAGILVVQAGVEAGFGIPWPQTLLSHHAWIESRDIFSTVAAYAGILSLERLFERQRAFKAAVMMMALAAAWLLAASVAGIRAPYVMFGSASAVFLRAVQAVSKGKTARFGIVSVSFGVLGTMLWARSAGNVAGWMVMGLGYQVMTTLAARLDRGVSERLQM